MVSDVFGTAMLTVVGGEVDHESCPAGGIVTRMTLQAALELFEIDSMVDRGRGLACNQFQSELVSWFGNLTYHVLFVYSLSITANCVISLSLEMRKCSTNSIAATTARWPAKDNETVCRYSRIVGTR